MIKSITPEPIPLGATLGKLVRESSTEYIVDDGRFEGWTENGTTSDTPYITFTVPQGEVWGVNVECNMSLRSEGRSNTSIGWFTFHARLDTVGYEMTQRSESISEDGETTSGTGSYAGYPFTFSECFYLPAGTWKIWIEFYASTPSHNPVLHLSGTEDRVTVNDPPYNNNAINAQLANMSVKLINKSFGPGIS